MAALEVVGSAGGMGMVELRKVAVWLKFGRDADAPILHTQIRSEGLSNVNQSVVLFNEANHWSWVVKHSRKNLKDTIAETC